MVYLTYHKSTGVVKQQKTQATQLVSYLEGKTRCFKENHYKTFIQMYNVTKKICSLLFLSGKKFRPWDTQNAFTCVKSLKKVYQDLKLGFMLRKLFQTLF